MADIDQNGPVVIRDPGILGGRPVFRGTRVPVETVFDNLIEGVDLEEILENFGTLDRRDVEIAIRQACEALKAAAPDIAAERSLARVP
jgi:uncharacterized protein (DUF433 family)